MVSALVIGYGSIGARHARILTELGCRTSVVSSRQVDFPIVYSQLADGLAKERPDCVVIANSTIDHHGTLSTLAQLGYAGSVLVEKPVFDRYIAISHHNFAQIHVAYNLRFHPVVRRLKALLVGESILSVQAYVGQYLPEWRPSTDYRESYSASALRGGGALRDLSHELDYLTWMLGGWERVSALGGHLSSLEITSDDVFALLLVTPDCPIVSLQLNYLDRLTRRVVVVNTCGHTIEADLIRGTVTLDRDIESLPAERDYTYREMHKAVLSEGTGALCSLNEGLDTLRLIDATELAARSNEWIAR